MSFSAKKYFAFFLLGFLLITSGSLLAQSDPGTDNLAHQWTFDDGSANDAVTSGAINGTLRGGATIENKALVLAGNGQYLSFPGSSLNLRSYSVISQEIWFTSKAGTNTGYTMLSYFGNTNTGDGLGYNYISTSVARGDNVSRTAISNGTYNSEIGANAPEYDDGQLHQLVSVIRADSVILYIDGELASKVANSIPLSTIGTSLAYLGKGGYNNDPTWIGSVLKFSIYNKSLAAPEVKFLYETGAETSPFISSATKALAFDENYLTSTVLVSAANLDTTISVICPDGISAEPNILEKNAQNKAVKITYDGTSAVDGAIVFSSGDASLEIPVKSYSNDCFVPLYENISNLVPDPYVSKLSSFTGWGSRSINANPEFVYCGATSGRVSGSNGGSLDVPLTGKLSPETKYRIRASVYTIGGAFQIGVFGWASGQGDFVKTFNTGESWQEIDFTVVTGTALGSNQGIFFNNYGLSGSTGYIDNWEMYAIPAIYLSQSSLEFKSPGSKNVAVRGVSLSENIQVSAPVGFDVSQTSLPPNSNGSALTVTFNPGNSAEGYIYFTSGSVRDSIWVSGSSDPLIESSVEYVSMDEISVNATFRVTAYNLPGEIALSAPEGISLSATTLSANANNESVIATYDGQTETSGFIYITSGTAFDSILVLAERNDDCFTPLFPERQNLIVDPTCNNYLSDGWGSKSINTNPDFVYCGSRSGKVNGSGSLDRSLTGKLKTNTSYRMRAKVYKVSTTGEDMGRVTFTMAFDSASFPRQYRLIKEAVDSACFYFNKYTPFIENIRVVYNAGIPTAQAGYHGELGFGANERYMWVGTAIHEMAHYFGSGTTSEWQSRMVGGRWTGQSGNELISEITNGSSQAVSGDNNAYPVHYWPYGINQKEEITGLGSVAVQTKALGDAVRLIKAMLVDDCGLPTNNPSVGLGVYGFDATKGDIYHEVETKEAWEDLDFSFRTGSLLKSSQGVFFNSGTGYIDNWELYELSSDASLLDILADSISIEGFDPGQLEYDVELAAGTSQAPDLSVVKSNDYATIEISDATTLPGSAKVKVTSEDGLFAKTYTVNFSVLTSVDELTSFGIKVYPTYSTDDFTVETNGMNGLISVYNLTGKLVLQQTIESNRETIRIRERGMYLVKVESKDLSGTFKIFKTK